jgi:hypothetical protein
MFRYHHRHTKDINIFVPDPQYLGFVTPRLSDVADSVTSDYLENQSSYVKLIRPEGEIDFVASPNLNERPYEIWNINGQDIRVETAVKFVAKKSWHRGDQATARDLFDLSLVIEKVPIELLTATKFLQKNAMKFVEQINSRQKVFAASQFDEIDVLDYRTSYEDAVRRSTLFLEKLL